jgi:hypothetical protein
MTTLTAIPKSTPPATAKTFKSSLPMFWCADEDTLILDDLLDKLIVIRDADQLVSISKNDGVLTSIPKSL